MTALNPIMTVGKQIEESVKLHNAAGRSHEEIKKRVDEVLELVGIPASRRDDYPMQFSGGMKQRVVIAIALACSPDILIADEPTTALDVTIQAQVLELIKQMQQSMGMSMLMITHDLGIVVRNCDEVGIMYAGQLVEYGTVEQIFSPGDHHPYTEGTVRLHSQAALRAQAPGPYRGADARPHRSAAGLQVFAPAVRSAASAAGSRSRPETERDGHRLKCFFV